MVRAGPGADRLVGAALALAAVTRPFQRYPENSVETTPNSVWTDRDPLQGSRINFELSRLACLRAVLVSGGTSVKGGNQRASHVVLA